MKLKIIPIAIILMILISPFAWAAGDKVDVKESDKKIDKKVDEGKVIDKTKEPKKDVENVPKELDGKIKIKDSDTSKYKVEKTDKNSIKITKEEVAGEHTKTEVSVDTAYLTELDKQANADGYIGYMRKVDGQVVDVQKIKISDISSGGTSTIPATFSEVIVSGFSGTRTTTFNNVINGQTLDIQDGAKAAVTISTTGTIPPYTTGISSDGLLAYLPMSQNLTDMSGHGNNGVATNGSISYAYGSAYIGSYPYVQVSHSGTFNQSSLTMLIKLNVTGTPIPSLSNGAFLRKQNVMSIQKYSNSITTAYDVYAPARIPKDVAYLSNSSRTVYGVSYNATSNYLGYSYGLNRFVYSTSPGTSLGASAYPITIGGYSGIKSPEGYYKDFAIYSKILNTSEYSQYYAGASGISIRTNPSDKFTGYNVASGTAKTLDIGSTVTSLVWIDTTLSTRDVTVTEYFTEDTTLISDTTNTTHEVVHISHSTPGVKTAGTIAYQVAPLYSGTPALVSNNPNAIVTRNATSFIVSTGYIPSGTTYNYTVTVANDHNHGMWLNRVLQWMGSGFGFVGEPPTDYTNYIGDQIEVTVS